MTPDKPWQPLSVIAGITIMIAAGLFLISTLIAAPLGIALLGYAVVYVAKETIGHAWNALEQFTDWFKEGHTT